MLLLAVVLLPGRVVGQGIIVAGNYDGTNFNGGNANVGLDYFSGYFHECAVNFAVAGSGDFSLTQITMPLFVSVATGGMPNPANYQISIVGDNGGQPAGSLIGALIPIGPVFGPTGTNYTFDITGIVHGGASYWLVFSLTAPDNGAIGWNFAWAPNTFLPGLSADRWSSSGLPTGAWSVFDTHTAPPSAFLLEGVAIVPEPQSLVLLVFGLAGLFSTSRWSRRGLMAMRKPFGK